MQTEPDIASNQEEISAKELLLVSSNECVDVPRKVVDLEINTISFTSPPLSRRIKGKKLRPITYIDSSNVSIDPYVVIEERGNDLSDTASASSRNETSVPKAKTYSKTNENIGTRVPLKECKESSPRLRGTSSSGSLGNFRASYGIERSQSKLDKTFSKSIPQIHQNSSEGIKSRHSSTINLSRSTQSVSSRNTSPDLLESKRSKSSKKLLGSGKLDTKLDRSVNSLNYSRPTSTTSNKSKSPIHTTGVETVFNVILNRNRLSGSHSSSIVLLTDLNYSDGFKSSDTEGGVSESSSSVLESPISNFNDQTRPNHPRIVTAKVRSRTAEPSTESPRSPLRESCDDKETDLVNYLSLNRTMTRDRRSTNIMLTHGMVEITALRNLNVVQKTSESHTSAEPLKDALLDISAKIRISINAHALKENEEISYITHSGAASQLGSPALSRRLSTRLPCHSEQSSPMTYRRMSITTTIAHDASGVLRRGSVMKQTVLSPLQIPDSPRRMSNAYNGTVNQSPRRPSIMSPYSPYSIYESPTSPQNTNANSYFINDKKKSLESTESSRRKLSVATIRSQKIMTLFASYPVEPLSPTGSSPIESVAESLDVVSNLNDSVVDGTPINEHHELLSPTSGEQSMAKHNLSSRGSSIRKKRMSSLSVSSYPVDSIVNILEEQNFMKESIQEDIKVVIHEDAQEPVKRETKDNEGDGIEVGRQKLMLNIASRHNTYFNDVEAKISAFGEEPRLSISRSVSSILMKAFSRSLQHINDEEQTQNKIVHHSIIAPTMERKNGNNIDFTLLFDILIDKTQPLSILRIEQLAPVPIESNDFGNFCVGDCYIALQVQFNPLKYNIYTWIPEVAAIDKKFCCAMYAVGIRNWLEAPCRIQREIQNEESPEFLALFESIEYQDEELASASGLFKIEETSWPTRLYRIFGTRQLRLCLTELKWQSLDPDSVFLLDTGYDIFQWNGSKSKLQHKTKCRLVCQRINKGDRQGKASCEEFNQGDETEEFWEILGGRPSSDYRTDETLSIFVNLAETTNILYRVFSTLAPNLESHIIASGQIKRSLLMNNGCYIIDAGVEFFLWIGNDVHPELRLVANDLLTVFCL